MSKDFIKTSIIRPKKKMEGMKKMPMQEMGSIGSMEKEKFISSEKVKPSKVPSATSSENKLKLDSFIKANTMKSKELDPEESVHNMKEEEEEGYSLSPETEKLSEESPKVKKKYEEWLKKKKHLEMMGE